MSAFGLTKNRQVNLVSYAENIRRGVSRTIAALLDRQPADSVARYQERSLRNSNATTGELRKLYRMIGGLDSVNQQVVQQLDRISRRG